MSKKILMFLTLAIIGGVAFFATQNRATKEVKSTKNTTEFAKLDIGVSQLRISLPIFVAKEKGLFKKNGLDVSFVYYNTAQPLMQSLVEGKVKLAGYTALPIIYNGMQRSKKELLFLTTMVEDDKHRISYLLKKKGSTITDIKSLEGKKIGILPTIAYSAWVKEILKVNGVNIDKTTITPIAPMQQGQSLANGAVDALFTNDPVATTVIDKNIGELLSQDVDCAKYIANPFPFGSFNVDKKWADSHPKELDKVRKSLNEAVEFVNSHPQEAKLLMKNHIPDAFKPYVSKYPDALYLKTYESSDKIFNDIAEKYLEIGIIKKPMKLDGLTVK
jgi:NitT/TauT family transport system substrate-binding protein